MRRIALLASAFVIAAAPAFARGITYHATDKPAEAAFADLMRLSGYNFSYDAALLRGRRVSVSADNATLQQALTQMLRGTGVTYTVKGRSVVLRRANDEPERRTVAVSGYVTETPSGEPLIGALVTAAGSAASTNTAGHYIIRIAPGTATVTVSYPGYEPLTRTLDATHNLRTDFGLREKTAAHELGEVTVEADRNNHIAMHSSDIGRINLTRADIAAAPALFGEADVIKTLQMQPGVTGGVEGLAAMHVHGGAQDQNLFMLDNVPLYQVNHFGGLFSAFNTEAIKNVDFYKSSFPARYNGRLSSFMAVNTRDGNAREHHGSFRLGLTSGAFNIDGPIVRDRTTYSLAVRRSWFDVLSVPVLAIINSTRSDKANTTIARYDFMDVNAKINHSFSDNSRLHAMFYYGSDYLKGGSKNRYYSPESIIRERREKDISRLSWGNIVGSLGWRMQWHPALWSEITASVTRYNSLMRNTTATYLDYGSDFTVEDRREYRFRNRITDWSARADFGLSPAAAHRLSFGAAYTIHRFLPGGEETRLFTNDSLLTVLTHARRVRAGEGSAYFGYEADITDALRADIGVNAGFFHAAGSTNRHLDPRASVRWHANDLTTLKAGYSRTTQYVHQLAQSSLALPTDRWIPVPASMKPETADKISAGFYRELPWRLTLSAEVYYKWMHNLIDYRDDWYVRPADAPWEELLCTGSGRAYGLDIMATRTFGRLTGHVAYSLMWSDRLFADKNGGRRFPSRFDNRHKINIMASYRFNDRWEVSAAWTGMSGNRITLATQDYELLPAPGMPWLGDPSADGALDLAGSVNNRRLPFYHRLDLSANRHTLRGMWTFSLYNAYCNMNVIAIRKVRRPVDYYPSLPSAYRKYRLIPILPSVSYTWFF